MADNGQGFVFFVDNDEVRRGVEETKRLFTGVTDHVAIESGRIDSIYSKIGKGAAGIFAGLGTGALIKEIVRVRSEFQNTEASFKVFLGDAEKAAGFMKKMQDYAFHNVFEFSDLTKEAANLLAFRTEADQVIPVLDRLSNIAAGANKPLSELVNLFNKVKSTDKLMSVDIQQWGTKGVNILYELSKILGVTEAEVSNLVTKGKVGFKELEMVLASLTDEGGQFAGMMTEKMKTLGDSVGMLQDSWTVMLNEIGEKSQDILRGGILTANWLVEHYEKIGKIILGIVATYGVYRGAIAALVVMERIHVQMQVQAALAGKSLTVIQTLQAVAVRSLSKAWAGLNKTMLTHPYVATATAIVGIAAAMWAFRDSSTAAEKALENVNKRQEEYDQMQSDRRQRVEELLRILQDENETLLAKDLAYDELLEKSPALAKNYDREALKTLKLAEATKVLNAERDAQNLDELQSNIEKTTEKIERLQNLIEDLDNTRTVGDNSQLTKSKYLKSLEIAKKELEDYQNSLKDHQERIRELRPVDVKIAEAKADLGQIEAEFNDAKTKLEEEQKKITETGYGVIPIEIQLRYSYLKSSMENQNELIADLEKEAAESPVEIQNKAYWEKIKKDAEAKRDLLKEGTENWKELTKIIDEAELKLKAYTGSSRTADQIAEDQKRLKQQILSSEHNLIQSRIDVLKDGHEKELKQLDLNLQQNLAKIDQDEEELKKAYRKVGKAISADETAGFAEQRVNARSAYDNSAEKLQLKYMEEIAEMERKIGDVFLTETGRKQAAIKKTYEDYRKWVREAFDGGTINSQQYAKMSVDIDKAELESSLYDALQEFRTYEEKRLDIVQEFQEKITLLEEQNTDGRYDKNIEEATKLMNRALSELDDSVRKAPTTMTRLFEDMSRKSVKSIRQIADEAEAMLAFLNSGKYNEELGARFGLTEAQFERLREQPELMKAIKDEMYNARLEADRAEPAFDAMVNSFKKLFKLGKKKDTAESTKEIAEVLGEVSDAMGEASDQADRDQTAQFLDELEQALQRVTKLVDIFCDALRNIGDLTGNDTFGKVADGISDVMGVLNQTVSGATTGMQAFGMPGAIIGGLSGLVGSITGIFAKNKQHRKQLQEELRQMQLQSYLNEFEINRLYRERYEWAQKIGESTLTNIKRQGQELTAQTEANAKEQEDLWAKLMGEDFISNEYFKKTGLFGWGKGKIVKEWSSLAGMSWEEIERLAADGKLSEDGQKYYEALKAAREEGENLAARQEEYLEMVREVFTGTSYDGLVNSIVDAFKAGKRSAADFADTFEQLMQQAVLSSLSLMTDEKMRKWYEKFAKYSEEGLTEEKIAELQNDWNNLINNLGQYADDLERVTGIAIGGVERQAVSKGIQTASQDSIDYFNGHITTVAFHTRFIMESVERLYANSNVMLNHVAAIRGHTSTLPEMRKDIQSGNSDLIGKVDALSDRIDSQLSSVSHGVDSINRTVQRVLN